MKRILKMICFLPALICWLLFSITFSIGALLAGEQWGFSWKLFGVQAFICHDKMYLNSKVLGLAWRHQRVENEILHPIGYTYPENTFYMNMLKYIVMIVLMIAIAWLTYLNP